MNRIYTGYDTTFRGPNDHHNGLRAVRDSREVGGVRYQSDEYYRGWKLVAFMISAIIFSVFFWLSIAEVFAQSPQIYDRQTGKYLGNLNSNQFDPNSVSNQFGRYGSQFSNDSINNRMGTYGSPFSNKSVNNPWATQSPVIVAPTGRWGN